MKTSPYFEQVLFYAQTPATDQFFEESSDLLFQTDGKESYIDIQDQSYLQEALNGSSFLGSKEKNDLSLDDEYSSIPPSPLDQALYLDQEPPRYVQISGLRRQEARNREDVKRIARVWILSGCPFFTANVVFT